MSRNDFDELKKHWYQKLKESGFEDIELPSGGLRKDIQSSTRTRALHERESRIHYYSQASEFLHIYQFDSCFERSVWELFSNGKSVRETVSILNSSRWVVWTRLNKIKTVFDFYLWVNSGRN